MTNSSYRRSLCLIVALISLGAGPARAAKTKSTQPQASSAVGDTSFQAAKAAYQALRKDEKRRKFRHHWLNVAKKFELVASKYPKSERAPEALFWSGELYSELSRFSHSDDDLDQAQKNYAKLVATWPTHRLADDAALSLARLLADRRNDPAAARRVASAALDSAGDKKRDLAALRDALPAPSKPAALEPTSAAAAMAEATRRASATVARVLKTVEVPEVAPTRPVSPHPLAAALAEAQARRVAVARPIESTNDVQAGDEAGEEPDAPAITALQEKLRDVRVGAKPLGSDPVARARFKSLVKSEGGAELTLAQQLGLKVRRVIIDAGHGGHDTGAIGPKGSYEKDATLAISLKLQKKLEAMGLEVMLTRDDDTFVKLEDRTKFANSAHGDLFISIHCNAAPSKALRGIETYTLNTSSNRYSIRLAARENATTERGVGDLQYILADLATKANTGESTRLAERVQKSLIRSLSNDYEGVRDLGTKEALFFVLLGAKMPAILVETSFISNPEDEARLSDETYQQKVADSVALAVDGFLEERNQVAQVD